MRTSSNLQRVLCVCVRVGLSELFVNYTCSKTCLYLASAAFLLMNLKVKALIGMLSESFHT